MQGQTTFEYAAKRKGETYCFHALLGGFPEASGWSLCETKGWTTQAVILPFLGPEGWMEFNCWPAHLFGL